MVNTSLLKQKIFESGLRTQFIADRMGICRESLRRKLNKERAFTVDEAKALCDAVGIHDPAEKDAIFFAS